MLIKATILAVLAVIGLGLGGLGWRDISVQCDRDVQGQTVNCVITESFLFDSYAMERRASAVTELVLDTSHRTKIGASHKSRSHGYAWTLVSASGDVPLSIISTSDKTATAAEAYANTIKSFLASNANAVTAQHAVRSKWLLTLSAILLITAVSGLPGLLRGRQLPS